MAAAFFFASPMMFLAAAATSKAAVLRPAAKIENRRVLDLPPREGNPRNSEGAFIELRDGRILFVYSQFIGASGSDHAKARLAARFSISRRRRCCWRIVPVANRTGAGSRD